MSEVEHFMPILMEKEEEGTLSPILAHGGVRFMWIKHNNLYRILCTADSLHMNCWMNHRMTWVEGTSKTIQFQPCYLGQGCQPLNQAPDQAAPFTVLLKTHSEFFFFITWWLWMRVPEHPSSVVATSKKNACVSLVFSFLYKVVQVSRKFQM